MNSGDQVIRVDPVLGIPRIGFGDDQKKFTVLVYPTRHMAAPPAFGGAPRAGILAGGSPPLDSLSTWNTLGQLARWPQQFQTYSRPRPHARGISSMGVEGPLFRPLPFQSTSPHAFFGKDS